MLKMAPSVKPTVNSKMDGDACIVGISACLSSSLHSSRKTAISHVY